MSISNTSSSLRSIQVVQANPFTHGQGFQAYSVNQKNLGTEIAPFLQLDHYFMTQPTFAEHPHQGFSAVTYMFEDSEGSFFNEDSQGDRPSRLVISIGHKLDREFATMKPRSNQAKCVTAFKCL